MSRRLAIALTLLVTLVASSRTAAHPVPSFTYDRVLRVRLSEQAVEVTCWVELADLTILRDIDKLVDEDKQAAIRSGQKLRDTFREAIGPLLADRLEAWQDERPLTFRCTASVEEPNVDHPKFRFVLTAAWAAPPGANTRFRLQLTRPSQLEDIHLEKGRLDLAFDEVQGVTLADRVEAPAALKDAPEVERSTEQERRLRELSATVAPGDAPAAAPMASETPPAEVSIVDRLRKRGLVALLDSDLGLGVLLALAGVFGAAHALTPGHGKTLVAAYLVGQRGTVGHAFLLGLITTVTHTGVVIILAALLPLLAHGAEQQVQALLGFGGGLLIAGLGVWLLLRRLAGGADHVHIGAGHHHHHGPGGHHHHLPTGDRVRVWDLLVLGVSGGIVPCWDAIALLAMALGTGRLWLGLPLLLTFSAGLAGVLVLIGVLVVKVKGFGSSRFGAGPLVKALPIVSAVAVTLLGIWLCLDSATGR